MSRFDKSDKIEDIISRIRDNVDILDVASHDLSIELKRAGSSFTAPCPYCGGTKAGNRGGNFMISSKNLGRSLNIFNCFKCGEGGDVIKLYAHIKKINYVESAIELANKFHLISISEYEQLIKRKMRSDKVKQIEKKYKKMDAQKLQLLNKTAHPRIMHYIYDLFIKESVNYSDANAKKINYKHLVEERKLTEEEIIENRFFTFPSRRILKKMGEVIKSEDLKSLFGDILSEEEFKRLKEEPLDLLKYVPGFYFVVNKKVKVDNGFFYKDSFGSKEYIRGSNRGCWSFVSFKDSLAFPLFDENKQILGIQIRLNKNLDGTKYMFFSSSKYIAEQVDDENNYIWGASPGSPIDVTIPKQIKTSYIAVTEGKFKALRLAKETNMVVYSVQGVGSWREINTAIEKSVNSKNIQDRYTQGKNAKTVWNPKNIYLAYDSDMMLKPQVFRQSKNMSNFLVERGYNIHYLLWDKSIKGIDDILEIKGKSAIEKVEKQLWETKYELALSIIQHITKNRNPKEDEMLKHEKYFNYSIPELKKILEKFTDKKIAS